jgi:hypothetical protein
MATLSSLTRRSSRSHTPAASRRGDHGQHRQPCDRHPHGPPPAEHVCMSPTGDCMRRHSSRVQRLGSHASAVEQSARWQLMAGGGGPRKGSGSASRPGGGVSMACHTMASGGGGREGGGGLAAAALATHVRPLHTNPLSRTTTHSLDPHSLALRRAMQQDAVQHAPSSPPPTEHTAHTAARRRSRRRQAVRCQREVVQPWGDDARKQAGARGARGREGEGKCNRRGSIASARHHRAHARASQCRPLAQQRAARHALHRLHHALVRHGARTRAASEQRCHTRSVRPAQRLLAPTRHG